MSGRPAGRPGLVSAKPVFIFLPGIGRPACYQPSGHPNWGARWYHLAAKAGRSLWGTCTQ